MGHALCRGVVQRISLTMLVHVAFSAIRSGRAVVAGLVLIALAACDEPSAPPPVTGPQPDSIVVTPVRANLLPGDTLRLAGRVIDERDSIIPGTRITWASSNAGIISVDSTGLARARALGSVIVEARAGAVRTRAELQVIASPAISCRERVGTPHGGTIATETWRRADNPHLLVSNVVVEGTLTIEPAL